MKQTTKSNVLATGLAMFSMFFGAGNVVFPLGVGKLALDQNLFAIFGLLITAIGVPFMGLISMTLFHGDYQNFFQRIGKIPGFLFAFFIMGLIGPFGALPRTIALSYSTINLFYPGLSILIFCFISCIIVFLFSYKRNRIVDILGYFLTPFLLISLAIIIIRGLMMETEVIATTDLSRFSLFLKGLTEGYQTMDLLGALFFSSVVIESLNQNPAPKEAHVNQKTIIFEALKASVIAASLLATIYIGFSYVAALHSSSFPEASTDQLLGLISLKMLGSSAGIVACSAVALACLTTAIALATVFAEFLHKDITQGKLGYIPSLVITMIISFFVSTLNFNGIVKYLGPVLEICYPALIVLSLVNLFYKLHHFKPVKTPVIAAFILTLLSFVK
jgi:LIVCS family branched-chain amino acid:cation transporter